MKKRVTVRKKEKRILVRIRNSQRRLPAGFHQTTDQPATIRHVVSSETPTIDGAQLTLEQEARLTALRIRLQSRFKLVTPGGMVGKTRALKEVRELTPLGRAIIEIERSTIQFVRDEVERRGRARRRRSR